MTLIIDQSTASKGVNINLHSSSLIKTSVKSPFPYKYQPSSGLSSSLLIKTSCLRLKLVELNFFASFNADDQRKTYVSNVFKYTFKSSRWTFSIIKAVSCNLKRNSNCHLDLPFSSTNVCKHSQMINMSAYSWFPQYETRNPRFFCPLRRMLKDIILHLDDTPPGSIIAHQTSPGGPWFAK